MQGPLPHPAFETVMVSIKFYGRDKVLTAKTFKEESNDWKKNFILKSFMQ